MDYDALTIANSERAEAAEARGDAVVDARPMRFVMEFTADCNLHCFMCDCEMLRNKARDVGIKKFALPVESFRKLVEHFFPSAHQVNPTVVGEPFVLGYFDELLDACEKYSVKLDLHTNGMLMRGDRLRKLMRTSPRSGSPSTAAQSRRSTTSAPARSSSASSRTSPSWPPCAKSST